MELFILGLVLGVGAAKGKAVTKALAKGYMTVADKAKNTADHLREDLNGALEEARQDREHEEMISATPDIDTGAETVALYEEAATVSALHDSASILDGDAQPSTVKLAATGKPKPPLNIMKRVAKSYLIVSEKTRGAVASIREDMQDAIEEARYERERSALRTAQNKPQADGAAPGGEAIAKTGEAASATKRRRSAKPASETPMPRTQRAMAKKDTGATSTTPRKTTRRAKSAPERSPAQEESHPMPEGGSSETT
jgi:hypothetical protein